ncbi:MAG: hypothetical protein HEQ22_09445 [Sphingopyxis sp.]|uniref:hypothetical protein n=1 Tax=Sphingopyxis sp. TaxID=1908224 RepID=UPI003D80DE1C
MTPNPVIKFPQILGAALSANVFVVIASSIAKMDIKDPDQISILILLFLWNLKDGIDDFKSYESNYADGFSLAPTVTFRVLSYMSLVGSAINFDNRFLSFVFLSIYFLVFSIWSVNSVIRRTRGSKTAENLERLRRRRGWLILYPASIAACLVIACSEGLIFLVAFAAVILGIFAADCDDCETFSNDIIPAL